MPLPAPPVTSAARQGLDDLWQRSAKVAVPIGGIGGFVSDVLSPLGPFVAGLAVITGAICLLSGTIWFGFKQREIRRAMADGQIDPEEFARLRSGNIWSVSFAFTLIATVVLVGFFGAQKALAAAPPEKGAVATVFPGIVELQSRLLGLEQKTARIDETTRRIDDRTLALARAVEQLDTRIQAMAPQESAVAPPQNTTECPPAKELSRYAKVFTAPSLIVETASLREKNSSGLQDMVIRLRGPAAEAEGLEGRAIRYAAVTGFGGGVDYVFDDRGEIKTRLLQRTSHEGDLTRVFLGGVPIDLRLDPKKSREFCAGELESP